MPFVSRLVRTYNPILWQLLEDWGIGELPLQLEREREFVNTLRGAEAARVLSDGHTRGRAALAGQSRAGVRLTTTGSTTPSSPTSRISRF